MNCVKCGVEPYGDITHLVCNACAIETFIPGVRNLGNSDVKVIAVFEKGKVRPGLILELAKMLKETPGVKEVNIEKIDQ